MYVSTKNRLPEWATTLTSHYVIIRVDARNQSRRRKHYRLIEKEKLRLAELGYCQECIKLVCRFLSRKHLAGELKSCDSDHAQMTLF